MTESAKHSPIKKGIHMSEQYNAKCDICGKPYKICRSCQGIQSFQPWRTVVDTLPHYTIYLALAEYEKTKNKDIAREELEKCDLSERDSFNKNIKKALDEIFSKEETKEKTVVTEKVSVKRSSQNSTKTKEEKKNEKNIEK